MARKQIRVSRRMLFTWFILGGFIFFFAPRNLTNKFQFAFDYIFSWPLSIGRSFTLSARMEQSLTNGVSRREYNKLQNLFVNVIEERDQAYQEVEKVLGLKHRLPLEGAKLKLAGIIRASGGPHSELIINLGQDDGLAEGQFVLGDNSVIGTVSNVSARTARVKLFTDPTSHIEVNIGKLDVNRLMQGSGKNSAKVQMLTTKHKVEVGNKVLARRKPGFLNAPMIIGKVAQRKRDDENPALWDITVEPVCDIEKLDDVVVIVMNP